MIGRHTEKRRHAAGLDIGMGACINGACINLHVPCLLREEIPVGGLRASATSEMQRKPFDPALGNDEQVSS